jgi:hypothetical protein
VVYKKVEISKGKEVKGMGKFLGVSLAVGALAIAGTAVAQLDHGSRHDMNVAMGHAGKAGHEMNCPMGKAGHDMMKSHASKAGHQMKGHAGKAGDETQGHEAKPGHE